MQIHRENELIMGGSLPYYDPNLVRSVRIPL